MTTNVFEPAVNEMLTRNIDVFGPIVWQKYLEDNNLAKIGAQPNISIDFIEKLNSLLQSNNIMVFRMGTDPEAGGSRARFALVRKDIREFFIFDEEVFTEQAQTYLPTVGIRDLFAYQVLPKFSEASMINLGLSSGLLSYALDLERDKPILNPATGQSTFTFELHLHTDIHTVFMHHKGQIEIDSVFLGRRQGKDILFILEAKSKTGSKSSYRTIAKHKLVYSLMAISHRVPRDIELVPVYVKVDRLHDGFHYNIVECRLPDPRIRIPAVNELEPVRHNYLVLPSFGIK